MVKTKITETTEIYDDKGNIVERTIREETSEDDTDHTIKYAPTVPVPKYDGSKWEPMCNYNPSFRDSMTYEDFCKIVGRSGE